MRGPSRPSRILSVFGATREIGRRGNWLNGKGPFLTPPVADTPSGVQMPINFPALPGLSWSVHKRPSFSTRVASHGAYPGLGVNSLQSLIGLYIKCQGEFGTFLYIDPTDNAVTGQAIATG